MAPLLRELKRPVTILASALLIATLFAVSPGIAEANYVASYIAVFSSYETREVEALLSVGLVLLMLISIDAISEPGGDQLRSIRLLRHGSVSRYMMLVTLRKYCLVVVVVFFINLAPILWSLFSAVPFAVDFRLLAQWALHLILVVPLFVTALATLSELSSLASSSPLISLGLLAALLAIPLAGSLYDIQLIAPLFRANLSGGALLYTAGFWLAIISVLQLSLTVTERRFGLPWLR